MNADERSAAVDAYLSKLRKEQSNESGHTDAYPSTVLGGTGLICPQCGGLVSTLMGPSHGDYGNLIPVARRCLECPWKRSLLPRVGD